MDQEALQYFCNQVIDVRAIRWSCFPPFRCLALLWEAKWTWRWWRLQIFMLGMAPVLSFQHLLLLIYFYFIIYNWGWDLWKKEMKVRPYFLDFFFFQGWSLLSLRFWPLHCFVVCVHFVVLFWQRTFSSKEFSNNVSTQPRNIETSLFQSFFLFSIMDEMIHLVIFS